MACLVKLVVTGCILIRYSSVDFEPNSCTKSALELSLSQKLQYVKTHNGSPYRRDWVPMEDRENLARVTENLRGLQNLGG